MSDIGTYLHVFYQTALAFVTIMVLTIILGKQQMAEMTFFEYVNGITFGSIAGTLASDIDQKTSYHFVGLVIFGLLTLAASLVALKSRRGRKLLEGEPVIVVRDGRILEENMKKVRYTVGELMELLRKKDVFDVSQVQFAIIENDGSISVMKKPQYQQPTFQNPSTMPKAADVPVELIVDGQVIYENLRGIGRTGKWLMDKIKKKHDVDSFQEVFYALQESDGTLYVDLREDKQKKNG
ncbi:DUF421 domain-containing protein [Desmospora profundinema]|uniref:Uncharacterized membrane protein YcaP (DUF421 family) n=1 Tax=Desmospora profundinema TaxID=1571184 RepID=A0ABU1IN14_9BACL|nr:DUF421 domain-containing protein [Desmospora profundinema]MDR6226156.1 uncharacterized membrane protein YcaP (DUF421 family) [Desmospora profundinema]